MAPRMESLNGSKHGWIEKTASCNHDGQGVGMALGTVFIDKFGQAVSFPEEVRLPKGVDKVSIRASGSELIVAPLRPTWDSFFINGPVVSDDFLPQRHDLEPERGGEPAPAKT